MPKVSQEHKEQRKQEIIDACEQIYREKGFTAVTIKEISTATSFTRPAIYTYFETKDEILLALLVRDYEKWCSALERVASLAKDCDRMQLAQALADTLNGRETLLRIQNMNLYEIEQNSRVERLAEFKVRYRRTIALLTDIVKFAQPSVTDGEAESFCITFSSFLFGVYPFAYHTQKQIEAMKIAEFHFSDKTISDMVYQCLIKILPE